MKNKRLHIDRIQLEDITILSCAINQSAGDIKWLSKVIGVCSKIQFENWNGGILDFNVHIHAEIFALPRITSRNIFFLCYVYVPTI